MSTRVWDIYACAAGLPVRFEEQDVTIATYEPESFDVIYRCVLVNV